MPKKSVYPQLRKLRQSVKPLDRFNSGYFTFHQLDTVLFTSLRLQIWWHMQHQSNKYETPIT